MTNLTYLRRLFSSTNLPLLLALLLLLSCVFITPFNMKRAVHDIQVIFDISQSMNVEDVLLRKKVVSRLVFSKQAAESLLRSLPCGSRVGWSVFSGRRTLTLITPIDVCLHYAGLLSSLAQIDGRMRWTEASSIGKGLHQGMRAAQAIGNNTTVVYISDGHEAPPLRQGQRGIPKTDRLDVNGLVVGVGGNRPVRIPKSDKFGNTVGYWQANEVVQQSVNSLVPSHEELSQLHADHLIKLAQLTKFAYVELSSVNSIADAVAKVGLSHMKGVPTDLRWLPASLALLLLCWRFLPRL